MDRVAARQHRRALERERRARKRAERRRAKAESIRRDSDALLAAADRGLQAGIDPAAIDAVVCMLWWDNLSNQCAGYIHPRINDLVMRIDNRPVYRVDIELALREFWGWDNERIIKRLHYSAKYLLPGPGRSDIHISSVGKQESTGESSEKGTADIEAGSPANESTCDHAAAAVGQGAGVDCNAGS